VQNQAFADALDKPEHDGGVSLHHSTQKPLQFPERKKKGRFSG
jgi:hypothetical protein